MCTQPSLNSLDFTVSAVRKFHEIRDSFKIDYDFPKFV